MNKRDTAVLKSLDEEEAKEKYHLQYLDGEIRFLEELIESWYQKLGGARRYTREYS